MFQVDKIKSNLYGIVGFRQPFNPTNAILDTDNQISRSGYYVTDNPYVKIESLLDVQDYKDIDETNFNLYLKRIQESSIINVCNQVFSSFDYRDRNLLYKNANNKVEQESLIDGFVGYKICVSSEKNVAFKITRVLLDFDTVGDFKLLLFNTNKKDAIYSKDITITDTQQEVVLNWVVDNSDITYKGDYYLGYVKTATTPIPYTRNYDNSDIMSYFSKLSFEKVQVKGHATETLFDLDLEDSLSENIGLNPDITVYDDYTSVIIQNEHILARAIQLDMIISVLREYSYSLRSNGSERKSEDLAIRILAEIEGQTGNDVLTITGLRPQLLGEISQIGMEMKKLRVGYFNNSIKSSTLT